ncbi:MAG TPA: adenosylmethionine decarboxylase [Candidatus Obscuribacterales bacterium]
MFGPHLILEAYGCSKQQLSDLTLISEILDAYPEQLNMTKIMPPYVFRYSGAVPDDWGVSGVVLIAESHISIHTFPDKEFVTLDIFSCKDFDVDEAIKYFCNYFKPKSYEKQVLMRGREFPRSPARAGQIVEHERLKLAAMG